MQSSRFNLPGLFLLGTLTLSGCATNGTPGDPLEPLNRGIYKFNDTVDKAVIKPVAQGYKEVTPEIVRAGVGNFFSNLDDVLVVANDLLQFKLPQAASDLSRLMVNTTFGVLGLADVATGWELPKHDEDFGQTLGYWGIDNGPYLVLPLLGSSTLRDAAGRLGDGQIDPVYNYDDVATRNTAIGINMIDTRSRVLDIESVVDDAALDRYSFIRDAYLQKRRSLVYDGNPPREKLEDD